MRAPDGVTLDQVTEHAHNEQGLSPCLGIDLPLEAVHGDHEAREQALGPIVNQVCDWLEEREMIERLRIPDGYEHLRRFMPAFVADHPDVDHNVFLMMRFKNGRQFQEVERVIRDTLAASGYQALRADYKEYASELWDNVVVYMLGCPFGIAVFEEIDEREFNPNVALELGFMLALGKRCLVLKDQRMPRLPTDIVGRLYRAFDTYDISPTLGPAVQGWLRDIS